MKKNHSSILSLFTRFVFIVNIIVLIIGTYFFIVHHKSLVKQIINLKYQNFLSSLNQLILFIGIGLIILNLFVFLGSLFYSRQKYFRLLDRIDFDNVNSSLTLLKKLNQFDEYGFLGEKIKRLLTTYLNFSNLKKLRINFIHQKFNFILNRLNEGSIVIEREAVDDHFLIRWMNSKAQELLSLNDRKSILIGRKFNEILNDESNNDFSKIIEELEMKKQNLLYLIN